ncbi:MAG TPA: 2Fe-2S iron-sulfur cluster-binding protein [Candidatus Acidoferrales bacterium]|nr:2Fe-2S iron-sulfur cluster-binding protein [Candidatus Acidoferrales bacterium]
MVFGRSANRRRARCLDITVVLRDEDDRAVPLSLPAGEDLMHGLQSAGVDITSICHGRAVCGMCRVLVTSAATSIVEAARDERRLLDILAGTTPQHRLACQISLGPEHEGLTFALDPPST